MFSFVWLKEQHIRPRERSGGEKKKKTNKYSFGIASTQKNIQHGTVDETCLPRVLGKWKTNTGCLENNNNNKKIIWCLHFVHSHHCDCRQ